MSDTPIVVVVRDPDSSNEWVVFNGEADVHDIDLGYMNLDDTDEYLEWASGHLEAADRYAGSGHGNVASFIRTRIEEACPSLLTDQFGEPDDKPDWTWILQQAEDDGGHS